MGEAHEDFLEAGADIVAVFQYRGEPSRNFCRRRGVPFTCLGDPERDLYHAVGLERGTAREYIGPQLMKGFVRAARKGSFAGVCAGLTTFGAGACSTGVAVMTAPYPAQPP